jgi:hypothetical protein
MPAEWDIRCADLELRRLQDGFTETDHLDFARVLLTNAARSEAVVHVLTGSLKASLDVEVTKSGKRRWQGEIRYGGESAGVNDPVRYAVSELFGRSPAYGGDHDYLAPTEFIDAEMVGPVSFFITRGRGTPHPEVGGA